MGFEENLSTLLKSTLPCEHTIRECLDTKEKIIRYGPDDEPWILCPKCGLAWPMWEYNIKLRVPEGGEIAAT